MGQYEQHVFVCTTGSTCPTEGDTESYVKLMRAEIAKWGLHGEIRINKSGCFSQCGNGPMVVVYPEGTWYAAVTPADVGEIVAQHLLGGRPVERLRYDPPEVGPHKLERDGTGRPVGRSGPWPAGRG